MSIDKDKSDEINNELGKEIDRGNIGIDKDVEKRNISNKEERNDDEENKEDNKDDKIKKRKEVKNVNKNEKYENDNKNKIEEIQRMTISKQAQDALTEIVEKVNNGFVGGKVNKTQVANWILVNFKNNLTDENIKEIRAEYFDEIFVLEAMLKKAKETGDVPIDFKTLLKKQFKLNTPKIKQVSITKKITKEMLHQE